MTIMKIVTSDRQEPFMRSQDMPRSTMLDLAKVDQAAIRKDLSYGQYSALKQAGWLDCKTNYKR